MRFAFDEKADSSANMRLPYGLERTVLPGAALQTELESPPGLASPADRVPISSESEANFETEPSLARGQDGPLQTGHDAALGSEQRSEPDQTTAPKLYDAPAPDNGDTVVDYANPNAALTAIAGDEKPSSDVSLEISYQFETLLNAKIVVLEGAEQVWSNLLANPTEQPAEHAVDAARNAAASALNGLDDALAALDTEIIPDHQRFDLSEAASLYESAHDDGFSAIDLDVPLDNSTALSGSTDQKSIDQPIDLHHTAEGVPPSEPSNSAADAAQNELAIPASGAYFIDVMTAVRPGMGSVDLLQALHVGQEHHG